MSVALENALARRVAIATALLARAVAEVRSETRGYIETGSDLCRDSEGRIMPAKGREAELSIEGEMGRIDLIREIEAFIGFPPVSGPAWFDEIIAQGPGWATGAPCAI